MNTLCIDEIEALENLIKLSGQDWFSIRTPQYLWDNDNKRRLNMKEGIKEFLSCAESSIKKLPDNQQDVIKTLWENVNTVDFNFDEV